MAVLSKAAVLFAEQGMVRGSRIGNRKWGMEYGVWLCFPLCVLNECGWSVFFARSCFCVSHLFCKKLFLCKPPRKQHSFAKIVFRCSVTIESSNLFLLHLAHNYQILRFLCSKCQNQQYEQLYFLIVAEKHFIAQKCFCKIILISFAYTQKM